MLKQTEKFSLRKSKKYKNLISVGLGVVTAVAIGVATDNNAQASDNEVKTENPATNSPYAQGDATKQVEKSLSQSNVSVGVVAVEVDKTELNNAVANAKKEGVKVTQDKDKNLEVAKTSEEVDNKVKEISTDYKKQTDQIKQTTDKYVKAKEDYKNTVEKVTVENKEAKEKYQSDLKKWEEEKAKLEKENKEAKEKYEQAKLKLDQTNKAIDESNLKIDEENKILKDEYDKALKEYQEAKEKYDNAKRQADSISSQSIQENVDVNVFTSTQGTSGGYVDGKDSGASFMSARATNSGNVAFEHDMVVGGVTIGYGKLNMSVNSDYTVNSDGSINVHINSATIKSYEYDVTGANYTGITDKIYFRVLNPVTGSVELEVGPHDGRSNIHRVINKTYSINKTITLQPNQTSESIQFVEIHDDWMFDTHGWGYIKYINNNKKLDIPSVPDVPVPPIQPIYKEKQPRLKDDLVPPTDNEIPNKPIEPKYKELPKEPVVPTVKYSYYKLSVTPEIEKEVKNTENQNINNQYVSKLSTVKWELKTKELPTGRKETNKYVITDSLPSGYVLDVEKSKEASKDFNFSYNKETHTVVLTGKKELIGLLNKDLQKSILAPTPVLIGTVVNDGATYKNNFSLTINNDYGVYSNVVKVSTPGKPNDPENPNNNLIKPEKHNYNENGVLIDGKEVLGGSINYYNLLWDLDQYKGIKATKEDIKKGFYYVDDYPEEALELQEKGIKLIDSNKEEVKGISVTSYESLEKATKEVKEMLNKAGIIPKGAFQLFTADNPEEFYNKYVVTGNSIKIVSPMKVKEELAKTGGKYENKAYQIDFGNGYETEVVVNNVPKIEPKKDVSIEVNGESVDGKEIELNKNFNYHLIGSKLPSNRADEIKDYSFIDDYDEKGDSYTGEYKVFSTIDITLKDKTVIKAGTDITKYTKQIKEAGKVTVELNKDFLEKVDLNSEFQADTYLQMIRIAVGEFENTYENSINGVKVLSNTVKTKTPEQPKEKILPRTSAVKTAEQTNNNLGYVLATLLTMVLGFFGIKRKVK